MTNLYPSTTTVSYGRALYFVKRTYPVTIESYFVPELYHPLIFVCFGIWGWIIVLALLKWQRIDINVLLRTTTPSSCQIRPLLFLAASMTALITFDIILLEQDSFVSHTNYYTRFGPVAICYTLVGALAMFGPCKRDFNRFLKCLYRLFFRFQYNQVYFSDILVADILISFAGVLTRIFVMIMQYTSVPYSRFVPFVNSIPYLIRLKQCCNHYIASPNKSKSQQINMFKYASAIPVVFLSHQTNYIIEKTGMLDSAGTVLWRIWLVSALTSNLLAFGWDLVIDWRWIQMNDSSSSNGVIQIRKDLYFSEHGCYVAAVGMNGCLRLLKVGSHLYPVHPFCVELAEIVRRWIWAVFRFENEWVKRFRMDHVELAECGTSHTAEGDKT